MKHSVLYYVDLKFQYSKLSISMKCIRLKNVVQRALLDFSLIADHTSKVSDKQICFSVLSNFC